MEMMFAVIMFCWANGSPECYGLALTPPRPLIYCEMVAPAAEKNAYNVPEIISRIEQWGEPTSVVTKCMTHAEAKESMNDSRTK